MICVKDDEFIRGNCPMTKEEVRIISITKMELKEEDKVLDVGAGTGSISIQASKICRNGKVIAIEKDNDALEVLYKNKSKFKTSNLEIIEGEAPKALEGVKDSFDGIFIGGSGGNIQDIINECHKKLKYGKKIVLNFITIKNLYEGINKLRELNYDVECIQMSINKSKGDSLMLFANNSIFIVSGRKK